MRDDNIFKAKLAEQVGRYDDMTRFIASAFVADDEKKPLLSEDVRVIASAYENAIGKRRSGLKYLKGYSDAQRVNDGSPTYASDVNVAMDVTAMIRRELTNIANECANLCQEILPLIRREEDQAVIYKLKGDSHRYLCEFQKDVHLKKAQEAYEQAGRLTEKLPGNDQLRLSVALSLGVFQAEVLNDLSMAAFTAQNALKAYSNTSSGAPLESCRQSAVTAQQLQQNERIWSQS